MRLFQLGRMVTKMSRIIQYIKLFIIALFYKCKNWWESIWNSKRNSAVTEKIKEDTIISSENYNSRFTSNGMESEVAIVKEVWDQIDSSIPKETVFPNPSTLDLFKPMKSDYYSLLFPYSPATPNLFVDRSIWTEILSHLPEEYEIPPTITIKLMKPMSSEYYEDIFSPSKANTKVFVDNRVWEEIMKNLPDSYAVPNSQTNMEVWTKRRNMASPIIMKHQFNNKNS